MMQNAGLEPVRSPLDAGPLGAASMSFVDQSPVQGPSPEQEINRLTWSVLDGSATLADRQRLAELVRVQHAVRRRFDR
jgi:hypothetical protein